ncbi:cytochrome P450 alkane hydroxylase [Hyphopichia burtonii NRRL Y-1933]|uniref:Cytochrome P450 alkane hydroxylase n=1 Tax=Hyphopichia burtonii NRRL Y-1933 TaxID=984485 RepID=A0A1E4RER8_9ASCO|nr:cytochrome P450 alkane hydroxylase [Hyphopichia burtonii NRRL Y-1933]ODV65764.1 cytochrome P450 alkane hydroxylase [Hyphopichia burtonii NRRL Y-1933]
MVQVDIVKEKVLGYLQTWYGALIGLYVLYSVLMRISQHQKAKKLGCKPIRVVKSDGFYGFKLMREVMKLKSEGKMVDYNNERFIEFQADTFLTYVAGRKFITTRDPENIKAVLATQFNDFCLGIRHAQFLPLLGDGIFTLDGEGWKHSRAMLRPQFAREQVAHVKSLEPHIQVLARHIQKYPNGGKFDIQELFFRLTVDSATEFLFGQSVESLKDETVYDISKLPEEFEGKRQFAYAFNTSQNYLATRAISSEFYFLINNKEFKECNAIVHKFADFYVRKALEALPEELAEKSRGGYIFLYELVQQTRDPIVLRDQLLNILLAGRDTTAGLLSFTFFELSRNPQIWSKLKEEIYEKFGSGEDSRIEEITFESLKKCDYLKAVLNEVLRLYPSVPQNFRIATKDTSLPKGGGPDGQSPIFVSKGQLLSYSVNATHHNTAFYGKDANDFRPERWFEPETRKLGWAFLPFNGGPRICLGQQFALTEASYVVTRLLQMFPNIISYDDEYPPRKNSQLTMCHQNGVFIGLD